MLGIKNAIIGLSKYGTGIQPNIKALLRRAAYEGRKLNEALDEKGNNILHLCVLHERIDLLKIFVNSGYDLRFEGMENLSNYPRISFDSKNQDGKTAIDLALEQKNIEAITLLSIDRDIVLAQSDEDRERRLTVPKSVVITLSNFSPSKSSRRVSWADQITAAADGGQLQL